jgi:RNA polymerase sigma-70 factor (ECF subfamily)
MVYRMALSVLGSVPDAEDAVQEVFLRLYRQSDPPREPEGLRRWLLRVTVNYCRDVLRSPWRKRRVPLTEVPDTPVFDRPEQSDLYQAVMALPEKYRTVLYLFYYEEMSVRELAELLKLSQSAVTTRLSRAREKLKNKLTEVWQDEQ